MLDYDTLAREYAAHRTVHPEVVRELAEVGRIRPESYLLEIGCGTGNYVGSLAKASGCRGWGIDPSREMISRGRDRWPDVEFRQGGAETFEPDGLGPFDLVFSVDVIHHVQDPLEAYRRSHRLLRSGGFICTVTDSEAIIRTRQPLAAFFPETIDVDLARYPSTAELRSLMRTAGFSGIHEGVVEFSYVTKDISPYRDRAFSCLHLIPDAAFRRGLARLEEAARGDGVDCVSRYVLLWGRRESP
jgi:SAM-dependent methyltransferase